MENSLVSIVLPSYNCAHFLPRAVYSVLDQTYPHWELLIIDNYSTDNTMDVLRSYQDDRIRILQIHNNGVIAKSRNLGIQEAKGRWVAFLDADDWWTKDKLEVSIQALCSGSDFVYHDLIRMGPGKKIRHGRLIRSRKLVSPVYMDLILNGNGIANSSVVVCRKRLLEIGGLSENPLLIAAEDYDGWLRIAKNTEKFIHLENPHGFYWIGKNNTHSTIKSLRYLNELRRLYFTEAILYEANGLPNWWIYSVVKAYVKEGNYEKALKELSKVTLSTVGYQFFFRFFVLNLLIRCKINRDK